jgi:hypothetical protein
MQQRKELQDELSAWSVNHRRGTAAAVLAPARPQQGRRVANKKKKHKKK